ncbi:hypothetical protein LALCM10_110056 [Dellaglioa algida]|nr:hypothetical protein LALCM10_110056 [Dellaglioa algida]
MLVLEEYQINEFISDVNLIVDLTDVLEEYQINEFISNKDFR